MRGGPEAGIRAASDEGGRQESDSLSFGEGGRAQLQHAHCPHARRKLALLNYRRKGRISKTAAREIAQVARNPFKLIRGPLLQGPQMAKRKDFCEKMLERAQGRTFQLNRALANEQPP